MQPPLSRSPADIPRWLVVCGSVAILLHLAAVVVALLAAPSGPWLSEDGPAMAMPPRFAHAINDLGPSGYLKYLRLMPSARLGANRPQSRGVFLEVRLKDASGHEMKAIRLPNPEANFWVRHRQALLAQALADDQGVTPQGEVIAAPGQQVPSVQYWDLVDSANPGSGPAGRVLCLRKVPQHLVPRERQVMRPSEWSLLLVRSYARHLCRTQGAAAVEIARHTREPIPPTVLFMDNVQPAAFD